MSQAAFLKAIRDDPADDTARLAYADYLDELGDSERAEFIRLQIELARMPTSSPGRRDREDRAFRLLEENETLWLGVDPMAEGLIEWEFSRGFVSEVAATPGYMREAGASLALLHPLTHWRVMSDPQSDRGKDSLREVGRSDWFSRLECLDLSGWSESIGELSEFLSGPDFTRLRELSVYGLPGLEQLPDVLARSPLRGCLQGLIAGSDHGRAGRLDPSAFARVLRSTRLTELALPGCNLTAAALREILDSDCCRSLVSLDVRDNPLEPDARLAFGNSHHRLRELDLSGTPMGAIALAEVLRQDAIQQLRVLHLNRCGSALTNIPALAGSRFWEQAEELWMQSGTIPPHSVNPLIASPGPNGMRVLDVSDNYLRTVGVRGLSAASWAASLEWLGLSRNYLTDDALRAIAESGRFSRLRTLHLGFNNTQSQVGADPEDRITDRGLVALAGSPTLANLRILTLSGVLVTAVGLDSVLNNASWTLTGLGLFDCHLTDDLLSVLAASPRLRRLEWLDLGARSAPAPDRGLQRLAESPYLSPLCELSLRGREPSRRTCEILRTRLGKRFNV